MWQAGNLLESAPRVRGGAVFLGKALIEAGVSPARTGRRLPGLLLCPEDGVFSLTSP